MRFSLHMALLRHVLGAHAELLFVMMMNVLLRPMLECMRENSRQACFASTDRLADVSVMHIYSVW